MRRKREILKILLCVLTAVFIMVSAAALLLVGLRTSAQKEQKKQERWKHWKTGLPLPLPCGIRNAFSHIRDPRNAYTDSDSGGCLNRMILVMNGTVTDGL